MNTKRVVGITLTVIVLLLLAAGARSAQTRDVSAEAPRVPPTLPVATAAGGGAGAPRGDPCPGSAHGNVLRRDRDPGLQLAGRLECHLPGRGADQRVATSVTTGSPRSR